jgi:hypothetical protein
MGTFWNRDALKTPLVNPPMEDLIEAIAKKIQPELFQHYQPMGTLAEIQKQTLAHEGALAAVRQKAKDIITMVRGQMSQL